MGVLDRLGHAQRSARRKNQRKRQSTDSTNVRGHGHFHGIPGKATVLESLRSKQRQLYQLVFVQKEGLCVRMPRQRAHLQ